MAKGERIGKVSVGVTPEFDQAALFRQVKAATAKVPALKLPVKISAQDVNRAIREVNQKKLVALKLPVSISVADVNRAVKEVNTKKLAAIKPPVQLTVREVNKAIREVNRKKLLPLKLDVKINHREILKTDRAIIQATRSSKKFHDTTRRGLGQFAANIVILRSAFGLIRVSAIGTAIGVLVQGLAAAGAAATSLASGLSVGLLGGLTVAASGATGLAQAMTVLKFSMEGVRDALGGANALNKQLDPKKFANLTPAAKSFVLQLERMKPLVRGLQQDLQQNLFEGLSDALKTATPLLKQLNGPLQETARTLGQIAVNAASAATEMSGSFRRIMTGNNIVLRNLGDSAIYLSMALVDVLDAATPLTIIVSRVSRQVSKSIQAFTRSKRESGELAKFMALVGEGMAQILSIGRNLGTILLNIFRGALPSGQILLNILDSFLSKIAVFTGTAKGQQALKDFFEKALPSAIAFGGLIKELGKGFARLATEPGLVELIAQVTALVPTLVDVIGKVTREFAPVLIATLGNVVTLFSTLVGASGPLNQIVYYAGVFAGLLNTIITAHPGMLKLVGAFFLLEAGLSILAVNSFIFRMSGLAKVIQLLTVAMTGASGSGGLFGSLVQIGKALRTFAGFARVTVVLTAVIFVIDILVNSLGQLFRRLEAGQGLGEAFGKAFAYGVVAAFENVNEAIVDTIKTIADFAGIFGGVGGAAAKKFNKQFDDFLDRANLVGQGLNKLKKDLAQPSSGKSLFEFPSWEDAEKDQEAQMKKWQSMVDKVMAEVNGSVEGYAETINSVGLPATNELEAGQKALTEANKAASRSMEASRDRLNSLGSAIENQRTLVDGLRTALEELRDVQLEGTKAFSDAKFGIDQQTKALQLQEVQLKLAGTSEGDPRFKEIADQLEALNLKAQEVDLTESLQLDPLRRKLDETFNPARELSFENILLSFQNLTKEHNKQQGVLFGLEKRYASLEAAIRKMDEAANKISATAQGLSSGLSAAVSAPAVIEEPMKAANDSLSKSNKAIIANVGNLREALRKPVRLGIQDINNLLTRAPNTIAPGANTLISYLRAIGQTSGNQLVYGLTTGMRSHLVKGSDLHKLLSIEIPEFIRDNKGPVAYDATILVPAGEAIMTGLEKGLRRGFEPVKGYLRDVGPSMEEYVPDSLFAKRTAEFLVDVAAGKKPNPKDFFGDLQAGAGVAFGGIADPRLGFLHRTMSFADTANMAASLAKTFGLQNPSGGQLLRPAGTRTASGGVSDHTLGIAADLSGATQGMHALATALKPLIGPLIKQLIYTPVIRTGNAAVDAMHFNHVHVAFQPAKGFSMLSGKIGQNALANTPYAALFQEASERFGVPAALLQAVTKAESGFRQFAGSGAGAKGLMQLMPATFAAQHVGSNIFDPRQNIFAGAKYLSAQLRKFKSLKLALAAYNAGPGNAQLALRSFAETIAYVARVMNFLKDFGGFREHGGPIDASKGYIVGEKGPEWFQPGRSGRILSNKEMTEMVSVLKEIRDTGGLRQQTVEVKTASQDPAVVAAYLEMQRRRKLARVKT